MKIFSLLLISILVYSCATSQQSIEKTDTQNSNPYDESFDPNTLNDDDIIIVKNDQLISDKKVELPSNTINDQDITIKEVRGYRVQIIATKDIESASQAELEAKDIFGTLNHKIYLIFDAPNYKVRVGDVVKRDEADEIREIAKDYGYRGAFVVKSKVNVTSSK